MMRALIFTLAFAIAGAAAAQVDEYVDDDTRGVIQNRKYKLGHEITLSAGTLPLDPFFKGLTAGGRYTFHINDWHAVEVSGHYSYNLDSYLTEQLIQNFGVQRQDLPGLIAVVDLNYVVKPFYGKFALANRTLLYQEVFFDVGGTFSYWSDESFRLGPDIGGGIRFFITPWFSLRGDIRNAIVFNNIPLISEEYSIDPVLYLGLGASLNFGG
jgi:outer membrane beta-barrel protein